MSVKFELPELIETQVTYPEWYRDRDWPGEQQERAYWDAFKALSELYGPKVPVDFQDFIQWLDGKMGLMEPLVKAEKALIAQEANAAERTTQESKNGTDGS